MFKAILGITSMLLVSSILVACGADENVKKVETQKASDKKSELVKATSTGKKVEGRWYTKAQLIRGRQVFKNNCAVCHGDKGQGLAADWKKSDAEGKFPPPPLNGSAHTWHHSKDLLMRTVNEGGIALGGSMPAFKSKLTEEEKEAVLAHVMSLWPKEIYDNWKKRNPATK